MILVLASLVFFLVVACLPICLCFFRPAITLQYLSHISRFFSPLSPKGHLLKVLGSLYLSVEVNSPSAGRPGQPQLDLNRYQP